MGAGLVLRTDSASRDILEIAAAIAAENRAAAIRWAERLEALLALRAQIPFAGRIRPEFAGAPRSIPFGRYVIFYDALPDGDGILVLRVLHGARDLTQLIGR